MPARTLEADIDRLYQLPLDEFTAARNALAKQAGGESARIRGLEKPSVPAWAVNQLYWQDRAAWDTLIAAAENARKVNRAVLAGKGGDVRAANAVHDEAVEAAFKATLALLARSSHPATDATRQTLATTLRALPGADRAGRLTKPMQPVGFEALAGLAVGSGPKRQPAAAKPEPARHETRDRDAAAARERTRQKQAEATAARELKDAEAAVRHEEFEQARLDREVRRAQTAVEKAQEMATRAKADLARAEHDLDEANAAKDAAAARARKAREVLARAKSRT